MNMRKKDGLVSVDNLLEDSSQKKLSHDSKNKIYERYYEDPRENAMLGYHHRITTGPSLESLKKYLKK